MKKDYFNNYIKQIFFIIIFINLNQIVISEEGLFLKSLNLDYTHALSLINGNIFILHKDGVIVYNYNFTIILYSYNFDGNPIIPSEEENNFTSIIQCDDDINQYVVAIIKYEIYIFSSRGQYLFKVQNNFFSDFITNSIYTHYSFLYYKYSGNVYYFIITYVNNNSKIKIIEFKINMNTKIFDIHNQKLYPVDDFTSDSIASQIINSNNLACFYIKRVTEGWSSNRLILSLFNVENNFTMINETLSPIYLNEIHNNFLIKSVINKNKRIIIINYINPDLDPYQYISFDIDLSKFSGINYGGNCNKGTNFFNINYFSYINYYIISCINNNGISLKMFSDDFNSFLSVEFGNCIYYINFDVIFLLYEGELNVITNFLCGENTTEVYNFPSYQQPKNFIKPSDEPDSNFFYSTSFPTTISKKIATTIPIQTTLIKPITNNIYTTIPFEIKTSISKTSSISTQSTKIITNILFSSPQVIKDNKCKLKCLICNEDSTFLN